MTSTTFRAAVVTKPGEPDAISALDLPVPPSSPVRSGSRWRRRRSTRSTSPSATACCTTPG